MKAQFTIATLLSVASALTIKPRADDPQYLVTGFEAKCYPRTSCHYEFEVAGPGGASAHCSFTGDPLGTDALPEVTQRDSDDNAAYQWSVSNLPGGGLALWVGIQINATTNLGGIHNIGLDELAFQSAGAADGEYYNGTTEFYIPASFVHNG
ncbi:hypothetical protein F5Y15DRAFT_192497 [Xylariaceae sp. FL0016]|nr:hypothetical protein F5Y15DRAFT_192497 [Xylariaceae sp. FL0016]